jgi:hypothetical protein
MGRENLPVHAAADGYVSRIKMEPGGFGHGLYITHPNGYTTLYAHLNDFAPAIQRYVRQQQYAKESWTVDLSFTPEQFPVKKGQQIAWSGNTGGSTAPHLHFEIRDSKTEHPLNPQLFGFEIKDTRAPVPVQLAVYGKAVSIYRQQPQLFDLKKAGEAYRPARDTIEVTAGINPIGIEVNDYMDGSSNTLAFYTAEWYLGDQLQGRIALDDIGYDETRYLHAYADYKMKQQTGRWIQLLYRLPGNKLDRLYKELNPDRGGLDPGSYDAVPLRIVLKDIAGNAAMINCYIRIVDGVDAKPCMQEQSWMQGAIRSYTDAGCRFALEEDQLYDDVCDAVSASDAKDAISSRYAILSADVPVHRYFPLSIRPGMLLPFALRNKVAMMYSDGRSTSGRAADPAEKGWYAANFRALGNYWLSIDTTAPVAKPASPIKGSLAAAKSIAFRATDNMTSIKAFRGELDGRWLLFEQHGSTWTYVFDEHCPKGPHKLVITATDENGNSTTQRYSFSR